MMKKTLIHVLVTVALIATSAPCKASDTKSELIILSGATEVRASKSENQDQASYLLKADFPATGIIEEIKTRMAKNGWQPLKEDLLNPGLSSSMVRGWSEFTDATKKPKRTVHQWITDWSNSKGEIVRYVLRYEYPEGKAKDLKNLKVVALRLSATTVKEAKKALAGSSPKGKK